MIPQSAIPNPTSDIRHPQSAIRNPQSFPVALQATGDDDGALNPPRAAWGYPLFALRANRLHGKSRNFIPPGWRSIPWTRNTPGKSPSQIRHPTSEIRNPPRRGKIR